MAELSSTTLPYAASCAPCRRLYAKIRGAVKWHASVFADTSTVQTEPMYIIDATMHDVVGLARAFPHVPGGAPAQKCRTDPPPKTVLDAMTVAVDGLETHGGMGRIYSLRDPRIVLKVADVRTSWCKYERSNYDVLRKHRVSCARIVSDIVVPYRHTAYVGIVMERLEFTMTMFLRACARSTRVSPTWIVGMLRGVLETLRVAGLVYCDLSPDNIMFREKAGDETYELVLVDPQFVVYLDDFRIAVGEKKAENFDVSYLALKVQAIGLVDPGSAKFTDAVCAGLLGHVPLEKHTRRWLLHDAPIGLFMAYDILRKKQ
jgi:hypothetical protein